MSMIANDTGGFAAPSSDPLAGHAAPGTWAIVPVKPLDQSKMRLSHVLAADRRAALMGGLLRYTLRVLIQAAAFDQILVVSCDPAVWEVARQQGALSLDEQERSGLNGAVTLAVAKATSAGAAAALILPADLPYLQRQDLGRMVGAMQEATSPDSAEQPAMVICGDRKEEGTNALLLRLPTPFAFHYGVRSFQKHLQEAERHGMEAKIVRIPTLQFDLDTETDWFEYQQSSKRPELSLAAENSFVFPIED